MTLELEIFKAKVHKSLSSIVDTFNKELAEWERVHGCNSTFRWQYRDGSKGLDISEITMPILRTEPQDDEVKRASDILDKASAE